MSKKRKGLFTLFIGLLAGVATGVLFSPTSGKKFREKVKKEVKEGKSGFRSIFAHFKALAGDIKNTSSETIKETGLDEKAKKVAKKATKELKATAKKATKEIKATAKKTVATIKEKTK